MDISSNGCLYRVDYSKDIINDVFVVPDGVTELGEHLFADCKELQVLVIAGSVKRIKNSAFAFTPNLTKVLILDGVESIGDGAFACCHKLNEVGIPDSVKFIGEMAFHQTAIKYITCSADCFVEMQGKDRVIIKKDHKKLVSKLIALKDEKQRVADRLRIINNTIDKMQSVLHDMESGD